MHPLTRCSHCADGNEHEVGAALTDCIARGVCTRADVFITSKLWVASSWPDLAMAALDKTLADLQTSYVDLVRVAEVFSFQLALTMHALPPPPTQYLIHWPFVISPGEKWTLPPPDERRMPYDPAQVRPHSRCCLQPAAFLEARGASCCVI